MSAERVQNNVTPMPGPGLMAGLDAYVDARVELILKKRRLIEPELTAPRRADSPQSERGYANSDSDHPHSLERLSEVAFGLTDGRGGIACPRTRLTLPGNLQEL